MQTHFPAIQLRITCITCNKTDPHNHNTTLCASRSYLEDLCSYCTCPPQITTPSAMRSETLSRCPADRLSLSVCLPVCTCRSRSLTPDGVRDWPDAEGRLSGCWPGSGRQGYGTRHWRLIGRRKVSIRAACFCATGARSYDIISEKISLTSSQDSSKDSSGVQCTNIYGKTVNTTMKILHHVWLGR